MQEDYLKDFFDSLHEAILILDGNMKVLSANRIFFDIFEVEATNAIGFHLFDIENGQFDIPDLRVLLEDVIPKSGTVDDYEIEHNFENIGYKTMLLNACKTREKKNDRSLIFLAILDITGHKLVEADLEAKKIAIREIIEQLEIERNILQENLAANIENLVMPTVKILQIKGLLPEYVDLLQRNIKELASSFGVEISDPNLRLSPKEIEISAMIKCGLTNKEIAAHLNSAVQTIERHRKNIRKKLGIAHKKINLSSYLQYL